jgi:hypothetical protein
MLDLLPLRRLYRWALSLGLAHWPWPPAAPTILVMPAKTLWTTEDLARHWHVTRSAVADRIARGTLAPDYIAVIGDRVMHLFDPERFRPKKNGRS